MSQKIFAVQLKQREDTRAFNDPNDYVTKSIYGVLAGTKRFQMYDVPGIKIDKLRHMYGLVKIGRNDGNIVNKTIILYHESGGMIKVD